MKSVLRKKRKSSILAFARALWCIMVRRQHIRIIHFFSVMCRMQVIKGGIFPDNFENKSYRNILIFQNLEGEIIVIN